MSYYSESDPTLSLKIPAPAYDPSTSNPRYAVGTKVVIPHPTNQTSVSRATVAEIYALAPGVPASKRQYRLKIAAAESLWGMIHKGSDTVPSSYVFVEEGQILGLVGRDGQVW